MIRSVLAMLMLVSAATTHAQPPSRRFPETGYSVAGRLLQFWEANGGLAAFGYPISAPRRERSTDDGQWHTVQHFERARLELHPHNQPPHDVLLGRLGVDQLSKRGIRWQTLPTTQVTSPGCRHFAATKHQICGRIRDVWEQRGLLIYGLPISDLLLETNAAGQTHVVQYFERSRFELHPNNQPPYDVLLGLLQDEQLAQRAPISRPTPQPYYVFPVQPAASVSYGRDHHDYPATDIFAPADSDFVAPTNGIVEYVNRQDRWSPETDRGEDRGGLAVGIIGVDGIRYYGSHLSSIAPGIAVGTRVEAGQLLGKTGNSGSARPTPAHLHFGISRPTRADDWAVRRGEINPYPFLQQWQRGLPLRPDVPWLD